MPPLITLEEAMELATISTQEEITALVERAWRVRECMVERLARIGQNRYLRGNAIPLGTHHDRLVHRLRVRRRAHHSCGRRM